MGRNFPQSNNNQDHTAITLITPIGPSLGCLPGRFSRAASKDLPGRFLGASWGAFLGASWGASIALSGCVSGPDGVGLARVLRTVMRPREGDLRRQGSAHSKYRTVRYANGALWMRTSLTRVWGRSVLRMTHRLLPPLLYNSIPPATVSNFSTH